MKRILLLIGIAIIGVLTFGCAQLNGDKNSLENMNAQEILEVLNSQGYPNDAATIYTEKGSTSGYPWSIKGCTSAVVWTIETANEGVTSTGKIEVYDNVTDCTNRKNSEEAISSFGSPDQDYFIQEGSVFMQIPFALTTNEAAQFEAALKAMAQGKTPEPYTPQPDSTDPGKDPDSNGGTEAPLISSFNKVLVNETDEGVGDSHVMSSSESAEFLTIMQEKNWTVVDDFPARDLDAIFTISNNDDDYIFVDATLYEGKTVILMKYNQDSQGIVYLAPAEVLNALIEFKAGLEAN